MTVPNSGEGQRSFATRGQRQGGTDVEAPGRARDDATGEVVPSGPPSGERRGKRAAGENLWAYLFLSPWFLGLFVLTLGPMLATLYFSFTDYPLLAGPEWTGLDNYKRMFFDDPRYLQSLKVTFIYVLLSVPLELVFALLVAMVLNRGLQALSLYRAIYYLPCGGEGSGGGAQMRMAWWGSTIRHQRTREAIRLFEKRNPNVEIEPEPTGDFVEYWNKIATQASGGNAPDVIQTDYRYLTEYAGRGVLMELDEYIPDPINLKYFNQQQLQNGQIDGKTYALTLGDNAPLVVYDVARLEEAGVDPPENWTWDDFGEVADQLSEAGGEGFYGTEDFGGQEPGLEVFVIQKGQSLYENGQLGFDEETLAEWLTYWDDLRKSGAAAPGDVQATDTGDLNTTLLIQGKAAIDFAFSNQYTGLSELTDRELDFTVEPGGPEGLYIKPSQLLSGYSQSEYPDEVAQVIDFFLNDKGANKILGTERGVSGNSQIREMLRTEVPKTEQQVFDYLQLVSEQGAPLPPPPPPGAAEVAEIVLRTNDDVSFGRSSVDEAVSKFFSDAKGALEKANQ